MEQGADVIDIGMVATPMVGTTVARDGYDGGVMISASHNPAEYNAFKLVINPCEQLSPETGMKEIEALCAKEAWETPAKSGTMTKKDVLGAYTANVLKHGEGITGLKVVVDYGNGVGSVPGKVVFPKLDITYIPMYDEPDGTFPNHPANPHDLKNLHDLQERVKAEKADLGIFFDGDADRSYLVDERGEIVPADMLVGLFAEELLKEHPGERVLFDLRFSKAVEEAIRKAGGAPVRMRVGNPFYKAALIHEGGILGGEFSGHVMFKENHFQDDGLFAAVTAMAIMCRKGKPISALIDKYLVYHQSPEINLTVKEPDAVMARLKERYADGKLMTIDGVLIEYPSWWFSIRKSNTEPLVRLRIEADTEEEMERRRDELLGIIRA